MMKQENPIAICTWSLHNDLAAIRDLMSRTGLSRLHLGVAALAGPSGPAFREALSQEGWTISATMVGFPQEDYSTLESIRETGGITPNDGWDINRGLTLDAIQLTAELGVPFLSLHAGFIDSQSAEAFQTICDCLRLLADAAKDANIMLLLETGQETADELRDLLEKLAHPALGVNFDPANMILYGKGEPSTAVQTLAPWIKHVHIKDARRSPVPGAWGEEVPWGDGEVDVRAFGNALDAIGYAGTLAIEREAGSERAADIQRAVRILRAQE